MREIRLSWSRLKTFEACKQRVLRTMEGKAVKTDGRVFLPGTVTDRIMREWLESSDPQPGQMKDRIWDFIEQYSGPDAEYNIKWKGSKSEDKARIHDQVLRAVTNLEPVLMSKVIPYDYEPELRFSGVQIAVPDLNEVPTPINLVGGMDIVVRDFDQHWEIIDLKTTENPSYVKSSLGQLVFYFIAFSAMFGIENEPTRAAFVAPLLPENYMPVTITTQQRREMYARIVRYCHSVWREEWTPTDNESECWNCPVKASCDRHMVPIVIDKQNKRRASFQQLADKRKQQKVELDEQRARDAQISPTEASPGTASEDTSGSQD